ncbi:MAG: HIT family protein [Opitutales bacterium]|nr:HIT family protein [Opitutales bacterium]
MPSIFTRILRGEAPASIVHRDTAVAAFLDIAPLSEGHCLVVPLQETAHLADLPPQTLDRLTAVAQKVGSALRAADPTITGLNWLLCDGKDAGQEVFHTHLHVIPRRAGDGLRLGGRPQKTSRADLDAWAERITRKFSECP